MTQAKLQPMKYWPRSILAGHRIHPSSNYARVPRRRLSSLRETHRGLGSTTTAHQTSRGSMKVKLKKLNEQTMVITGASSGIGLVTARMAADQGARLVLVARSEEALRTLVAE